MEKRKRKTRTLTEKQLWNEAVKKVTKEIMYWDGLLPNEGDRKFMSAFIYEKCAYKIKGDLNDSSR